MQSQADNIAFKVLRYLKPFGDNAGRYIYVDVWRNELIDNTAQQLEIKVTKDLRSLVETELKQAWQRILEHRNR